MLICHEVNFAKFSTQISKVFLHYLLSLNGLPLNTGVSPDCLTSPFLLQFYLSLPSMAKGYKNGRPRGIELTALLHWIEKRACLILCYEDVFSLVWYKASRLGCPLWNNHAEYQIRKYMFYFLLCTVSIVEIFYSWTPYISLLTTTLR